jgi:NAD kinase
VVCIGGDGTLLGAEEKYPGMPKIALRVSNICSKCTKNIIEDKLFDEILGGIVKPKKYSKLELNFGGQKFTALNEFNIKSLDPRSAIRFNYMINPEVKFSELNEILADGLVVSSAFGSSGYFKSISRVIFSEGIGITVNNAFESHNSKIVAEDSEIVVAISRGPAVLYCDNQKKYVRLKSGDKLKIVKSDQVALIFD